MTVTNRLELTGKIITKPVITHNVAEENFYEFTLETIRKSNIIDKIQVVCTEKLMNFEADDVVAITGEIRTYNLQNDGKSRLKMVAFVKTISKLEITLDENQDVNEIELFGFICKDPVLRITPKGRHICDVLVAVNRLNHKSDYIPVIVWGRNAQFVGDLKVGTALNIKGRLQSREYTKILDDKEEIRTAYELSAFWVNPADAEEIA